MRIAVTLLFAATLIVVGLLVRPQPATAPVTPAQPHASLPIYERVCTQCHGAAGEGNSELRSPSIAGQPEWYLEKQLEKFRLGHRGSDPRDITGQQMRAIALTLTDGEADEATRTISRFESLPTKATMEADPGRGRQIYEEQCIDCHRYNGSGEKVFGSSPLTGFQDWYLAAQIDKFRLGIRGYHPEDEKGSQMRHLLSYLDEGDAEDLAAYIAHLARRYPPDTQRR